MFEDTLLFLGEHRKRTVFLVLPDRYVLAHTREKGGADVAGRVLSIGPRCRKRPTNVDVLSINRRGGAEEHERAGRAQHPEAESECFPHERTATCLNSLVRTFDVMVLPRNVRRTVHVLEVGEV